VSDLEISRLVLLLQSAYPDIGPADCEDVAHELSLEPSIIAAEALALADAIRAETGRGR
jgi:hypothetical protein